MNEQNNENPLYKKLDETIDKKRREAYIKHLNENVWLYENRRRIFLELNIAFTGFFSFAILFFKDYFTYWGIIALNIGALILLVFTVINIIDYLLPHTTKDIKDTLWHKPKNKENFKKFLERIVKIDNNQKLIKDDLNDHHNLCLFQDNYHNLAKRTRNFTFMGLVGFFICFIISFIIFIISIKPS